MAKCLQTSVTFAIKVLVCVSHVVASHVGGTAFFCSMLKASRTPNAYTQVPEVRMLLWELRKKEGKTEKKQKSKTLEENPQKRPLGFARDPIQAANAKLQASLAGQASGAQLAAREQWESESSFGDRMSRRNPKAGG